MYSLTTQITFEAAHRLKSAYSEACFKNLHGHSYRVEVEVESETLNDDNMVCDFKKIKEIINTSLEEKYDHSCFLHVDDPLVEPIRANCKKVFVCRENPTAEFMARRFFSELVQAFAAEKLTCNVARVSVWETEHNMATYRLHHKENA